MVRPKSVGNAVFGRPHETYIASRLEPTCSGLRSQASKGVRAKESVTKQLLSYVPANGRITLKKTVPMSRLKLTNSGPARETRLSNGTKLFSL